jgi:hypothetical protein
LPANLPSTCAIGPIWQAPMQPDQISKVVVPSGLVCPLRVMRRRSMI